MVPKSTAIRFTPKVKFVCVYVISRACCTRASIDEKGSSTCCPQLAPLFDRCYVISGAPSTVALSTRLDFVSKPLRGPADTAPITRSIANLLDHRAVVSSSALDVTLGRSRTNVERLAGTLEPNFEFWDIF